MIKLKLTTDILNRHKNYILNESNIAYDLINLRYRGIRNSKTGLVIRALNRNEKKFIAYLFEHLRKLKNPVAFYDSIFLMTPEKLRSEIQNIATTHKFVYNECLDPKNDFAPALLKALGYKEFTDAQVGDGRRIKSRKKIVKLTWGAYAFTDVLGLEVCPYCHIDGVKTIFKDGKGKSRADLDHFTSKATHPYLSMSIFNLIPSCKTCNTTYKLAKDFKYATHINLYEVAMRNKLVSFSYYANSYEAFMGLKSEDIDIRLNYDKTDNNAIRLLNNCGEFCILERYSNFEQPASIVSKMLKDKRLYDDLKNVYHLDQREIILNNESDEQLLKQQYGKLKIDIYDEIINPTEEHISPDHLKNHEGSGSKEESVSAS